MTKRYDLTPLFEAMGMTPNQACLRLGVSGRTQQKYRTEGVTDRVAETLATKAGFHVAELWPTILDDRLAELPKCDECDGPYVRRQHNQRFCSERCSRRKRDREWKRRRYAADPLYRERRKQEWRDAWAGYGPAARRAAYARMAELRARKAG